MWQDLTIASVIHIIHWTIFQACNKYRGSFTQKFAEVLLCFQASLCDTTLEQGGSTSYYVGLLQRAVVYLHLC